MSKHQVLIDQVRTLILHASDDGYPQIQEREKLFLFLRDNFAEPDLEKFRKLVNTDEGANLLDDPHTARCIPDDLIAILVVHYVMNIHDVLVFNDVQKIAPRGGTEWFVRLGMTKGRAAMA